MFRQFRLMAACGRSGVSPDLRHAELSSQIADERAWRFGDTILVLSLRCILCLATAFHACSLFASDVPQHVPPTPNIVIIFMDDMGYADIGPFGGDATLTPHLNRMAQEGRKFTDFYVSQAVCSASRTSLLTGCYNIRVGIQGALGPASTVGIHADETTLGELCQQQNYATACFGKWHLGHHAQFLPLQNGFDEYFGLPYSNDMWPYHPEFMHLSLDERLKRWPHLPLIDGNAIVNPQMTGDDQKLLTTQYTERAVRFIEGNAKRPFFLYLAHSMVHVPLYVSEKHAGKSGKGLFSDVIMEIDWSVGRIFDALKRSNIDQNTLVIFTSDNGPWLSYGDHAGSAHPLREGKGTMFDGGCRVPFLARWPGRIPADSTCSEPAMTIDILPTVARLIGAPLPNRPIDGKDIWPLLAGEAEAKSPHEAYYFYWGHNLHAVRSGQWKLHLPHEYRTLNGRAGGTGGIPVKYDTGNIDLALFDLNSDHSELIDVAGQHPDVVARLQTLAEAIQKELGEGPHRGTGQRDAGTLVQPPEK